MQNKKNAKIFLKIMVKLKTTKINKLNETGRKRVTKC